MLKRVPRPQRSAVFRAVEGRRVEGIVGTDDPTLGDNGKVPHRLAVCAIRAPECMSRIVKQAETARGYPTD